jgi:Mitochondrial carrier protein.
MSGVASGALAQFFASPTDLVKVQIQMEGKRRLLGKPPRYVIWQFVYWRN